MLISDFVFAVEKEQFEIEIAVLEGQLKSLKADIKIAQEQRDRVLKKVDLAQNKLNLLDRSKMSFMNQILLRILN